MLSMFVVVLYSIHTIQIYARSPLERETQNMQVLRLSLLCNVLAIIASALLVAHFTVESETETTTRHLSYNSTSPTPMSS